MSKNCSCVVSRPTTVSNSNSDVVVNFGSAGSFTFNPLANWPLVVLQVSVFSNFFLVTDDEVKIG
jgi:hypothetical protein